VTVAKLPVTVTNVVPVAGGLYAVEVAYSDFTVGTFLIPVTLATLEAVTVSAMVIAQLNDVPATPVRAPHHKHRRYAPRT
jgi:H+/Cl- antiporter ClcA